MSLVLLGMIAVIAILLGVWVSVMLVVEIITDLTPGDLEAEETLGLLIAFGLVRQWLRPTDQDRQ